MNFTTFVTIIQAKMSTFLLIGLFVGATSFFFLTVTEKRFETATEFMVVQANATNQDFYTLSRSSEYLGKVLSESIYSERFINAVVESGKVNKEFLPFNKQDRLDAWRSMIRVEKNLELGILRVSVKSDSDRESVRIMDGISTVLIEKNTLFRSGDEKSVEVRILSGPITERNPSLTEIFTVVVAGFVFSIMVAVLVSFIRYESRAHRGTLV